MADQLNNGGRSKRKHIRQPPSVPFLWEEKPGIPKKNWKPPAAAMSSSPPGHQLLAPPVKLVASVPFNWEEKPGKPLPFFSSSPDHLCNTNILSSETDDSFSSASSNIVLPNCLGIPSASAVSIMEESIDDIWAQLAAGSPSSLASETDSSTSSYETGNSSLVGSSFLECLFPLFPPTSGFLQTISYSDDHHIPPKVDESNKDCVDDDENNNNNNNNTSIPLRRPTTLGELIMMSRRRSCQKKAVHIRKVDISMELMMKKGGVGCCMLQ